MLFDFYTAILEKLGIPIDISFNLLSAISFSFLLILIYEITMIIFNKNKFISILSCILFVLPSDFTFINFLTSIPKHISVISYFWHNTAYRVSSPLGDNTAGTFLNLNTYLNQRHLIFGVFFFLL